MRASIAAVVVLAVFTPIAFARTWTDSTGKYTVEAELLDFKDGNVQLKKEDGKTVNVPIEKLSDTDQEYVCKLKPTKEDAQGNRPAKDDDQAGDKAALAKSKIGVLVFREDGYAGPPVKKLEEWLNMPLADNFGKLYDDAPVKKVLNAKLADFQMQVLSEHKKTSARDARPRF